MTIFVLTLFPEMIQAFIKQSIVGRAIQKNQIQIETINFRDFAQDKHHTVDDRPYGGGPGMLLKPEPIFAAVDHIQNHIHGEATIILFSPQGKTFKQEHAMVLTKQEHLILICGHYEGFDERIRIGLQVQEISIGDYVLTGGEIPALVLIDSVTRLLPNVLGNEDAHNEESFVDNMLEYPQYTRPKQFRDMNVPNVLLSGNHKEITKWRYQEAMKRTQIQRPDLL